MWGTTSVCSPEGVLMLLAGGSLCSADEPARFPTLRREGPYLEAWRTDTTTDKGGATESLPSSRQKRNFVSR